MNREAPLSITQQCRILDIPRATFYHRPSCASDADLEVMRLMDRCHMELAQTHADRSGMLNGR